MSLEEHKSKPPLTVHCVVLSITDSRSVDHDTDGRIIESLLHEKGHEVVYRRIIKNDPSAIKEAIAEALADEECEAIITAGGTGVSRKDVTYTTLSKLYEEPLPGFGEVFRNLSYEEIGSAAILSRASAGIIEGHPVFSLPGSTGAVRLAMNELILPELSHIVGELRK